MNIKGGSLETYSETCWVSIYDTTNSIVCVRSAIDKPIKRVINLLESHMASLADCFIGIVQIAIALKKIPTSNNFRTLAIIGLKKEKILEIYELATNYYKEAHHNDKEYRRLMNEHTDLQKLAKTMFAIVPSQANCERNFSILKWFTEGRRTWLQVLRLESMVQLHSYYISNVEKELKLRDDFAKIELHLVNLSDPIFGADNNQEEPIFIDEETSMEFDSRSLVQDMLSDSDLYE
ncbi:16660_t:CDS:2 [Gigaspora margarita]|uniref:16660_t:CDS:1 n=1 Tax=Gigaspora margarita TaxID=4874 RepID=A0ABN7UT01_GIGMA|nr:16660_t:CDS:2 [Gigaspora margarita]